MSRPTPLLHVVNELRMLEPGSYLTYGAREGCLTASLWATRVRCYSAAYGLSLHLSPTCGTLTEVKDPVVVDLTVARTHDELCWTCATLDSLAEFYPEASLLPTLIDLLKVRDNYRYLTPWQLVGALRNVEQTAVLVRDVRGRVSARVLSDAMLELCDNIISQCRDRLRDPSTQTLLVSQLEPRFWSQVSAHTHVALAVEHRTGTGSMPVEADILEAVFVGSEVAALDDRRLVVVPEAVADVFSRSRRPFDAFFHLSETIPAEKVHDVDAAVLRDALTLWDPRGEGPLAEFGIALDAAARLRR